jgi:hypothetical protein
LKLRKASIIDRIEAVPEFGKQSMRQWVIAEDHAGPAGRRDSGDAAPRFKRSRRDGQSRSGKRRSSK